MNPVDNNSNTNPSTGTSDTFGPAPAGGVGGASSFLAGGTLDIAKDSTEGATKPEGEGAATGSTASSAMTMDAPETPFVPASPVPGSIGSATSGPAVGSTNLAAAVAPSGTDGGASFAPVSETNPTMPPVGGNSDLIAQAANEAPATSTGFNPFAPAAASNIMSGAATGATASPAGTTPAANSMTGMGSASNPGVVPSPFQAKMDNLAAKNAKPSGKSSNLLTIVFAGLAALGIITAIIFCVLWRQAVSNPEIRYVQAPSASGDNANAKSAVTCSRMYGGGEVPGMDNLVNEEASLTLNFNGDEWQSSNLYAVYNFTDAAAAEAANAGIFAAMTSSLGLTSDSGQVIVSSSSQPLDNRVEYREDTDISLMNGGLADGRDIPRTDDGGVQKNRSDVQDYYTSQGWTCK